MFTGLIQTTGTLQSLSDHQIQIAWSAHAPVAFKTTMELGDSIAVDGVCLTVTQILANGFVAAVSPETLRRTTLAHQPLNATVNLEASLRAGSKLGGHFVTGHIDGVGYLQSAVAIANAWEMAFTVPDTRVSRYIVPKGSIAINGVSLTVADCNAEGSWFTVAVIPLTYAETNLQYLTSGSPVNLEGDVLGKYVEKFLRLGPAIAHPASEALEHWETTMAEDRAAPITSAFLAEHGYL
ncbi:MAG: riboflavin synthase [Synechococcales bacterium]|nr:riboflavin synthase [Synechococcales bacterium]